MAKINVPVAEEPTNRLDRVLSVMLVAIFALVVLSLILFMIGTAGGWLTGSPAAMVLFTVYIGLPLCMVLLIALVIRQVVRKRKQHKAA